MAKPGELGGAGVPGFHPRPQWEAAEEKLEKGTFVEIARDVDDLDCPASNPDRET